jgi:uncharacterized membrane protein
VNPTLILVLAFGLGVVAGLRSMTAPAIVSWAARLGGLHLEGTPLAFLAISWVPYVLTALMLGELVADKLPRTPSRTEPGPFIGRLLTGGLSGAGLAAGGGMSLVAGIIAGALGAVAGTLGGYRARTGLVRALRKPDYVVALVEDVVAIGGAIVICLSATSTPSRIGAMDETHSPLAMTLCVKPRTPLVSSL